MIRALIVIGAILISLAGVKFHYMNQELNSLRIGTVKLETANTILKQNSSSLVARLKLFSEADVANKATIAALLEEREESLKAIEKLSKAKTTSIAKLDAVKDKIEVDRKTPNTDGPIAPVLKETIREIQILRNAQ